MRIVGGKFKGRIIDRVGKKTTRETADMVRESVFNMLGVEIEGTVLDLFSGSGAYGLEALSRGASFAYLIDHDKDAYLTMKKNVEKLGLSNQVNMIRTDYQTFLKNNSQAIFDYIFLDPPYQMDVYQKIIIALNPMTNLHTKIICETDKKHHLDEEILDFIKIKDKTYGNKRIHIYTKKDV